MENTAAKGITGFFAQERSKMLNYIRGRIADEAGRDAEDIMQDVMVKLVDGADINRPIENLASYIYTAIRNRIVDIMRQRKPQESLQELEEQGSLELADVLEELRSPKRTLENEEYMEQVYGALSQLDEDEQGIIIATEFEELSYREIAEDFEVPIGTLLSRKARALQKLKNILTKEDRSYGQHGSAVPTK